MGSSASTSISTEQFSVVSARLKDGGFANADANLVVVADSRPSLHRSPSILPEYEKAIVDGKSAEEIKTLLIASYESATASATPAEDVVEETTDAASVAAAPEVVAPVDEPVAAEAEATVEAAVEPTPARLTRLLSLCLCQSLSRSLLPPRWWRRTHHPPPPPRKHPPPTREPSPPSS
jgi:hypothetical protein